MSISHRSNRLKLIGNPSVEKLQNGRFRLTFNLKPLNPRSDWYNANKDRIFADYGTLQSAEMSIDGIAPRTGEAYGDMALINAESAQSGDEYVVQFIYETLGGTFIQIKDDTISYTENGLRRVTRESIAGAGTDFQKTVGTTSITSQIDTETAVTCYLARYEVDDTDSYRKVTEVYFEEGTLSQSKTTISEGVMRVVTTFLHTEGTTVGPVIARSIGEFEGLRTFSVTTLQDADGNSIVDGGTNLVHQYKSFRPFQYAGVISVVANTGQTADGNNFVNITEDIERPPAQSQVLATTYVFFQTASDLVQADYTYDSSEGLWSPNNWASSDVSISASGLNGFKISKGYRGYRTSSNDASGSVSQNILAYPFAQYNNSTKIGGFNTSISYSISIEKGPPDPINSKWVIVADITPAFDDVSGTTYYKKTLVVTDAIPAQSANAEVPYDAP